MEYSLPRFSLRSLLLAVLLAGSGAMVSKP